LFLKGTCTPEEEHKWAGLRAKTMEDLRVTWVALSKNRVSNKHFPLFSSSFVFLSDFLLSQSIYPQSHPPLFLDLLLFCFV
jgi:hypothetical protein